MGTSETYSGTTYSGTEVTGEKPVMTYRQVPEAIVSLVDKMDKITPGLADNFRHIQDEQFMLFLQKNLDYGSKNITAGLNLDNPEEIKFVLNGLWYRISDKVNRWRNIQMKGEMEVTNESFLDIFQDIANYACISSLVARGLWKS